MNEIVYLKYRCIFHIFYIHYLLINEKENAQDIEILKLYEILT